MSNSGIVRIQHTSSGRFYLTRSRNLSQFIIDQRSQLKNNRHACPLMQRDWNETSVDDWAIDTIETCPEADLMSRFNALVQDEKSNPLCYNHVKEMPSLIVPVVKKPRSTRRKLDFKVESPQPKTTKTNDIQPIVEEIREVVLDHTTRFEEIRNQVSLVDVEVENVQALLVRRPEIDCPDMSELIKRVERLESQLANASRQFTRLANDQAQRFERLEKQLASRPESQPAAPEPVADDRHARSLERLRRAQAEFDRSQSRMPAWIRDVEFPFVYLAVGIFSFLLGGTILLITHFV